MSTPPPVLDDAYAPATADALLVSIADGALVSHAGTVHRLNDVGAALWQLFDGSATIRELGADLADVAGLTELEGVDHVRALVGDLDSRGLLREARTTPEDDEVGAALPVLPSH